MMRDEQSFSPAKTVAGENYNEIINEQTGSAQVINQENDSTKTKETNSQDAIELEVEMCETSSLNAKDTATESTLGEVKGRDAYDYACLGSLYDGSFFEVELFKSPEWWNNIDNED